MRSQSSNVDKLWYLFGKHGLSTNDLSLFSEFKKY